MEFFFYELIRVFIYKGRKLREKGGGENIREKERGVEDAVKVVKAGKKIWFYILF